MSTKKCKELTGRLPISFSLQKVNPPLPPFFKGSLVIRHHLEIFRGDDLTLLNPLHVLMVFAGHFLYGVGKFFGIEWHLAELANEPPPPPSLLLLSYHRQSPAEWCERWCEILGETGGIVGKLKEVLTARNPASSAALQFFSITSPTPSERLRKPLLYPPELQAH